MSCSSCTVPTRSQSKTAFLVLSLRAAVIPRFRLLNVLTMRCSVINATHGALYAIRPRLKSYLHGRGIDCVWLLAAVLRCRELLEDLMPVIFGCASRNAETHRQEASYNIERRHANPRYRGVGH